MKTLTRLYLFCYNFFSTIAWLYVLYILLQHLRSYHLTKVSLLWIAVQTPLKIAQTSAILEIFHSMIGIVRSSPLTVGIQVFSRLHMVWIVWVYIPQSHSTPILLTCLAAWCLAEIIRYPFYLINLFDNLTPTFLKWLRYSGFIVLYPVGIFSEVMCISIAIPLMEYDKNMLSFPYPMPNRMNFEVNLHKLYILVLFSYIPATIYLFQHLLLQRKKSLYDIENSKTKKN